MAGRMVLLGTWRPAPGGAGPYGRPTRKGEIDAYCYGLRAQADMPDRHVCTALCIHIYMLVACCMSSFCTTH
jgi:hypothetical protein